MAVWCSSHPSTRLSSEGSNEARLGPAVTPVAALRSVESSRIGGQRQRAPAPLTKTASHSTFTLDVRMIISSKVYIRRQGAPQSLPMNLAPCRKTSTNMLWIPIEPRAAGPHLSATQERKDLESSKPQTYCDQVKFGLHPYPFRFARIPTKLRLKPTSEPGLSILLVLMGPSERGASLESSVPLRGKLDCFVQMLGRWSSAGLPRRRRRP